MKHAGLSQYSPAHWPNRSSAPSVMRVLLVLVLAVFTGCNAGIVRQNQPELQVDMVKDAFWEYAAKASLTLEKIMRQIRQSELSRDTNPLISKSVDAINKFTDMLRTQVAPLTQEFTSKLFQEAEQLKVSLESDLTAVSTRLQPYTQELVAQIQKQVEDLKRDAAPHVQSMDPEALKAVLLQKSQELKTQLDRSVKDMQTQMVPYTDEMKQKVEKSLEDFQISLIPLTQSFETQLTQKTQEIQQSLAPYGEELRARLDASVQDLQLQLAALWDSFTKKTQ
ncbi:uncharacterized protein ACBR49_016982 [Aulostomus maculatus]